MYNAFEFRLAAYVREQMNAQLENLRPMTPTDPQHPTNRCNRSLYVTQREFNGASHNATPFKIVGAISNTPAGSNNRCIRLKTHFHSFLALQS